MTQPITPNDVKASMPNDEPYIQHINTALKSKASDLYGSYGQIVIDGIPYDVMNRMKKLYEAYAWEVVVYSDQREGNSMVFKVKK